MCNYYSYKPPLLASESDANVPQRKCPFQSISLFQARCSRLPLYLRVKLEEHPNIPGVMQREDGVYFLCVFQQSSPCEVSAAAASPIYYPTPVILEERSSLLF